MKHAGSDHRFYPGYQILIQMKWTNESSSSGTFIVYSVDECCCDTVGAIPSATFHFSHVGPATGLCECIKYGADPLGDRHAASASLFRLVEVNKAGC